MPQPPILRHRIGYAIAAGVVIILGLASRRYGAALPHWLAAYAGDTLWALCVFLAIGVGWPRAALRRRALGALLFAYAIECSQLYHAPWIDAVRQHRLAALVLGSGFLWSDLLCYTVGVSLGVLLVYRGDGSTGSPLDS